MLAARNMVLVPAPLWRWCGCSAGDAVLIVAAPSMLAVVLHTLETSTWRCRSRPQHPLIGINTLKQHSLRHERTSEAKCSTAVQDRKHTASVIRFRFRLRPLADVEPWGDRILHWFALTDGWYWIEADGHRLFHHPANADREQPSPVDYYVVRLWEDIQEVLPSLLEPVPADLVHLMTSDQDAWYGAHAEDAETALDWYSSHFMYTSYLVASPYILWWRSVIDRDTITVDWRHHAGNGLDCTVPRRGRTTVATETFLRAVEEFDRELIAAMDQRIAEIEAGGLAADIRVDLDQLRHEHRHRSGSLAAAMRRVPDTDWPAVREGAARIFSTRTPDVQKPLGWSESQSV